MSTCATDSISTGTRTPAMRSYRRTTSTRRVQNDGVLDSFPSIRDNSPSPGCTKIAPSTSSTSLRFGFTPTEASPSADDTPSSNM